MASGHQACALFTGTCSGHGRGNGVTWQPGPGGGFVSPCPHAPLQSSIVHKRVPFVNSFATWLPHPQTPRDPQSGGLGILQRMILAGGNDQLTMALLARTVMNRKAVLDGGGTGFKAKSSSLYDILMAPGEYPNIQNNKFAQNYTSADLNKAGQAIGLAKNSKLLRER